MPTIAGLALLLCIAGAPDAGVVVDAGPADDVVAADADDNGVLDAADAAPRVEGDADDVVAGHADVDALAAALAVRGADAVYPEILAAIDDGNAALRAALADSAQRATTSTHLLELQRRRTALRLQATTQLSPDVRRHYEGLAPGSFAQLRRESRQVALAATHLFVVTLPTWSREWHDPSTDHLTSLLVHAGALLALALAAALVANRGTLLWRRARVASARGGNRTLARFGATLCGVMAALWSPMIGLIAVAVVEVIVIDIAHFGAVVVGLVWLRGWAWLRLVVAAIVEVIHWLAETPLGGLSPATTARVFSSVRFVGRAALVIVVAVTLSEVALGKGALYGLSARAAWIAAGVVAVVLVRRWQDDIATRYLALRPTGALADAVRDSRRRWFGFFVGVSALIVVFVQALSSLVRRFLLGFDQTRKALAFLFRRRLERDAKTRGPATGTHALPASVIAALSEHPDVDDTDLVADRHAADIARLRDAVMTWHAHRDRVGAAVLVGLPGHGKTTWVRSALRHLGDIPVTTVQLRGRLHSVPSLYRTFAAAFAVEADSLEALTAAAAAVAPRVVVVDDLHNLVLRGDPDHRVWRAFEQLVRALSSSAFVLATIDTFAEQHLRWANVDVGHVFRDRFELRRWSETEIEALLTRRVHRAGYTVRYDDLVVARVDDADRDLRLLATAREYARLIWDFAEGSPAVALQAWQRSLHLHDDGHLHVRLFAQPDERLFEHGGQDVRFILACVLWNENVTVDEAARGLAMPAELVAARLEQLREDGILVVEHQRYRVATAWWSMVLRFLRRKHLINL